MRVEVGVLGPVQLRIDGRPVPLPGVSQRVLLARLTVAAGRVVTVADLVDTLWPDDPPGNAVGNLHSYVSRLRRVTGSSVVRREPGGYRLELPDEAVDVVRVETLVAAAREREPRESARLLAEALAIWRGEPLSDVADRQAFAPDVARFAEWHRRLRAEWLTQRLEAGEAADAVPELEALAAAEPLREQPHLLLMRSLHQTGRSAEALAVGRAYRARIADEHGLDAGPALDELQQRILGGDPELSPMPRQAVAPWIVAAAVAPVWVDRFVGRAAELDAVREALGGARVTTVVGPGGAGKTRLVREALTGDELVVALADVTAPADVPTAVAGALGVRLAPRGGTAAVVERMGSATAVLVLDNCEHLLESVRDLVDEVVAACPAVRVLATSRQRLGCAGERVLRLGPLPESDQVELFCDRAAMLRADFDDGPRSRELAREVCRLVDGLPLAVELAARREAVFGLAQLRERLGAGLQVLDPARGGDRSTAVSATVEWSYRLLDPAAQQLLDRLSVCRGGFDLDSARHFSPVGEQLLADLVDASLVTNDLSSDPPRYRLLETVRHVGMRHLGDVELRSARDAHARWMSEHLADLLRRQAVRDPAGVLGLRRELANLLEALAFLVEEGRRDEAASFAAGLAVVAAEDPSPVLTEQLGRLGPVRVTTVTDALLALASGHAMELSSHYAEAERLLTAALDTLPDDHPMRWAARLLRLENSMFTGRVDSVHRDARLLVVDPTAPPWAAVRGPCCAALIDHYNGDPQAAARWLDEYAVLIAGPDRDGFVAFTRGELLGEADPEAALGWYAKSLELSGPLALTYLQVIAGIGRASVLIRLRRHDEAATACRDLMTTAARAGMTTQTWTVLRLAAELLADLGEVETAVAVLDAAGRHPSAPVVLPPDVRRHERIREQTDRSGSGAPDAPRDITAVAALASDALDRLG